MFLDIRNSFCHSIFYKESLMLNYLGHTLGLYLCQKLQGNIKCYRMQISKWIHFMSFESLSYFHTEQLEFCCTKTCFDVAFKPIKYYCCFILLHLSNSNSLLLRKINHLYLSYRMISFLGLYCYLMLIIQWTMVQFENLNLMDFTCKDQEYHHNFVQFQFNL